MPLTALSEWAEKAIRAPFHLAGLELIRRPSRDADDQRIFFLFPGMTMYMSNFPRNGRTLRYLGIPFVDGFLTTSTIGIKVVVI